MLSHFMWHNALHICDPNNPLIQGGHIVDASHGHQMSLLASLQVDPDNDSVLVRIPEDALTLPGG